MPLSERFISPALLASSSLFAAGASAASDHAVEGVWCFDVVQYESVVHVLTGDLRGGKATLWYSRSFDGGHRWARSVRVDTGLPAPQPSMLDEHARLGADQQVVRAVWPAVGRTGAATSGDSGRTWREAGNAGQGDTARSRAEAGGGATGSWHALTHASLDGAAGLYYTMSSDGGKTWTRSARLAGASAADAHLVRAADGMLAAVWEESLGSESVIFYALSLDDGRRWAPSARLLVQHRHQ